MNLITGLKLISAAAVLALTGCLGANPDTASENTANANTLKFADLTAASLAKTVATTPQPGAAGPKVSEVLRQAGICQGFIQMAEDIEGCSKQSSPGKSVCEDALPKSVLDFVDCFGIKISGDGDLDDIDTVTASLRDFRRFESCVCGGSGGFGDFDELKWQAFSASASANAGAAFQASNSSVAGAGYNGSNSTVSGNAYSGTKSTVATPYSGK